MTTIVILSTADFDAPLWTNKQFMARELSYEYRVVFVNSLGLRRPRFAKEDIRRIKRRLTVRSAAKERREVPPNVTVVRPRVIPFHRNGLFRSINRLLLRQQVLQAVDGDPFTLWTYSPLTYGLDEVAQATIYHAVDLLHTFPGVPADLVLLNERRLSSRVFCAIASSGEVERHLRTQGFDSPVLWTNVADVEPIRELAVGPREPTAIFAGNLTPTKVDIQLLQSLAAEGVRLVIAGPTSIDGTSGDSALELLLQLDTVEYVGTLSLSELAATMGRCTVGLIPYVINANTSGVFPMKVYEYMAAGLSVVSTPLPSLHRSSSPNLAVVDESHFVEAVLARLRVDPVRIADAQTEAESHSWLLRGREARDLARESS